MLDDLKSWQLNLKQLTHMGDTVLSKLGGTMILPPTIAQLAIDLGLDNKPHICQKRGPKK